MYVEFDDVFLFNFFSAIRIKHFIFDGNALKIFMCV